MRPLIGAASIPLVNQGGAVQPCSQMTFLRSREMALISPKTPKAPEHPSSPDRAASFNALFDTHQESLHNIHRNRVGAIEFDELNIEARASQHVL